jgi:hypothetical protein
MIILARPKPVGDFGGQDCNHRLHRLTRIFNNKKNTWCFGDLGENYKSIQKAKEKTPDSPFLSAQQYII